MREDGFKTLWKKPFSLFLSRSISPQEEKTLEDQVGEALMLILMTKWNIRGNTECLFWIPLNMKEMSGTRTRWCWVAGSDWDASAVWWCNTCCLCSPGECFWWETKVALSWLRWKEKAQKIFAYIRPVCNPLSLNIRLLKISAIKLFFTVGLLHFMVCKLHCLSWFDPTHVEMNLLISFLLCPVSSRSGVVVYSSGGM